MFLFFFPESVAVCMCSSLCSTPGKEERHVFIKKIRKQGVGKWQISRSLLLEYIDCAWFIDFLLQEVAQLSANREKFVSAICCGTFEADHLCTPCVQYVRRFNVHVSNGFFLGFPFFFFLSVCMFGIVCRRCSCKIGWWWVQWKGKSGEREREGRGRLSKTTEGKPDSEEVSLGTLSSSRQQSVSGGPPHPGCCQWRHQALQDPTSPDHQEPSAPGRSVLFYWFHPTPHCFHTILITLGQDPQAFICCSQQP